MGVEFVYRHFFWQTNLLISPASIGMSGFFHSPSPSYHYYIVFVYLTSISFGDFGNAAQNQFTWHLTTLFLREVKYYTHRLNYLTRKHSHRRHPAEMLALHNLWIFVHNFLSTCGGSFFFVARWRKTKSLKPIRHFTLSLRKENNWTFWCDRTPQPKASPFQSLLANFSLSQKPFIVFSSLNSGCRAVGWLFEWSCWRIKNSYWHVLWQPVCVYAIKPASFKQ